MLLRSFYAADIEPQVLTPEAYTDLVRSPFVDEIAGDPRRPVLVVEGRPDAPLPSPGALPVVVIWVGSGFGASGPAAADLVVGGDDLDVVLTNIASAPMAARTLAVLLRGLPGIDVDAGLSMESAAYSMLQGGPEFAAWRAAHRAAAVADDRPTVIVDRSDATLTITLDRPHRHNAISTRLRDELSQSLALAVADETIEQVLLRGNGPSFCSGGDLDEFGSRPDPVTAHITRLARSPARLIHRLSARTTVRLHGAALGGGIEMAAFAGNVEADPANQDRPPRDRARPDSRRRRNGEPDAPDRTSAHRSAGPVGPRDRRRHRTRVGPRRPDRRRLSQSLAGSALASLNRSSSPPTAGTPSPALVHNSSIVSASST